MEIAQLTTTRVAPIDFTANTVAEPRILNLRDSDEEPGAKCNPAV